MKKKLKIPIKVPDIRKTNNIPVSLRKRKDELAYARAKQKKSRRPLLSEPRMREWKYWALIDNDFPYTAAFKKHHMLIPKREVTEKDLNKQERDELKLIIDEVSTDYDCQLINFTSKQSVRNHYHIHLLTYKDKRKELKI